MGDRSIGLILIDFMTFLLASDSYKFHYSFDKGNLNYFFPVLYLKRQTPEDSLEDKSKCRAYFYFSNFIFCTFVFNCGIQYIVYNNL